MSDVDEGRLLKIDSGNFITDEEAEKKQSAENISRVQHDDEDLACVIVCKQRCLKLLTAEELNERSEEVIILCNQWNSLNLTDGTLYRLFEDVHRNKVRSQAIVPRRLSMANVWQCHVGMTVRQLRIHKTQDQNARRAYFPTWKNVVEEV